MSSPKNAGYKAVFLSHPNLFWVRDPFENLMKTVGSSPGKMHILHPHAHTVLQNYRTFTATPRHICASWAEDYTALVGREGQGPWGEPDLCRQRWDCMADASQEGPGQKACSHGVGLASTLSYRTKDSIFGQNPVSRKYLVSKREGRYK